MCVMRNWDLEQSKLPSVCREPGSVRWDHYDVAKQCAGTAIGQDCLKTRRIKNTPPFMSPALMRWALLQSCSEGSQKKHNKQALFYPNCKEHTEYGTFWWGKASNTADKFTKSKDDQWDSDGFPDPHAQVKGRRGWGDPPHPPLHKGRWAPSYHVKVGGGGGEDQWLRDRIWQTIGKSAREGENPVKGKSTRERDKPS